MFVCIINNSRYLSFIYSPNHFIIGESQSDQNNCLIHSLVLILSKVLVVQLVVETCKFFLRSEMLLITDEDQERQEILLPVPEPAIY